MNTRTRTNIVVLLTTALLLSACEDGTDEVYLTPINKGPVGENISYDSGLSALDGQARLTLVVGSALAFTCRELYAGTYFDECNEFNVEIGSSAAQAYPVYRPNVDPGPGRPSAMLIYGSEAGSAEIVINTGRQKKTIKLLVTPSK